VGVRRPDCASMFARCRPVLQRADLAFAQLETTISERGARVPNAKLAMRAPPAMARATRDAGFAVVSFAGNHCMDFGYEAFTDTLAHAAAAGLTVCGAGADLAQARSPAVVQISGGRVAFLAASAILPEGYAADSERRGCAPLRAYTVYEQIEHDQPGTQARVRTFAHTGDLQALIDGVRAARAAADWVVVSLHWGIHMIPHTLADYQIEVAHALIDAGAHALFGHHPHLLKGIEIYRGCPVFYSLGNFAIEQPHIWDPAITRSASFRHLVSLNPSWNSEQVYMLPEITRATGLAKLVLAPDGVHEVRFVPAWAADDSAPEPLTSADARFQRVGQLLRDSSVAAGFATRLVADGDEWVISNPG
jgi:poly-gamma-glutamate capsule biosynthesis protein CapA/YwtB (metallophosphatase superfamily)